MPRAVEHRRQAAQRVNAGSVSGDAEDYLSASNRDAELAVVAQAIAVDDQIARDPVVVRTARDSARRVLGSARHQPELEREVRGADVGRRPGETVRRIVDPDLDAVDVAATRAEKAQRVTGGECDRNVE
jgi:hypothetical protein